MFLIFSCYLFNSASITQVYALMRERDTLRREQNKRNDANALLKEKDEIISQVMAEGNESVNRLRRGFPYPSNVSCYKCHSKVWVTSTEIRVQRF